MYLVNYSQLAQKVTSLPLLSISIIMKVFPLAESSLRCSSAFPRLLHTNEYRRAHTVSFCSRIPP